MCSEGLILILEISRELIFIFREETLKITDTFHLYGHSGENRSKFLV